MYQAATVILGTIAAILGWLQYDAARKKKFQAVEFIPHRTIKLYLSRERVAAELAGITDRASEGDVLFGSCKTCANYSDDFCKAIGRAIGRGVFINFVVSDSSSSADFLAFLAGLDPSRVVIRKSSADYLRMYGIKGKEALIAFPRADAYIASHFLDERMVDTLFQVFQSL